MNIRTDIGAKVRKLEDPRDPFEIVLSRGTIGLSRPGKLLSQGSLISPNMSRMKRPSAIVDSDMRALTAKPIVPCGPSARCSSRNQLSSSSSSHAESPRK